MDPTVSSIMQTALHSISMDDSLTRVRSILDLHRLSSLPVLDTDGTPLGIVTRYDLAQHELRGKSLDSTKVWEICSYKPIAVRPSTSLSEAAEVMLQHHIHHVLVMEESSLRGIVSSLDFLRLFLASPRT